MNHIVWATLNEWQGDGDDEEEEEEDGGNDDVSDRVDI